jgi:hypothetical protein
LGLDSGMRGFVSNNVIDMNEVAHYNGLDGEFISGDDETLLEGVGGLIIKISKPV